MAKSVLFSDFEYILLILMEIFEFLIDTFWALGNPGVFSIIIMTVLSQSTFIFFVQINKCDRFPSLTYFVDRTF